VPNKNRRKLRKGLVARAHKVQDRKIEPGRLLPGLASPPTSGAVDGRDLARELEELIELAKRSAGG
jgi:hypothetical protein